MFQIFCFYLEVRFISVFLYKDIPRKNYTSLKTPAANAAAI